MEERPATSPSGWAWFFAGTTIALALILSALVWALLQAGIDPLRPTARAPQAVAAAPSVPFAPPPSATPAVAASRAPELKGVPSGPGSPPVATPTNAGTTVKRGEIVSSAHWRLAVDAFRSEPTSDGGKRLFVDFTLKNDAARADTLTIPATLPIAPRPRLASWEPVQLADPPALQLRLADRAGRAFGGGFVSANGEGGGSFTFVAAPGDAIKLTFGFEVPSSADEPFTLDGQFGVDAGGGLARVRLDEAAEPPNALTPSDLVKVNGKEERYRVEDLWSFTLLGISVGDPSPSGERIVTARLSAENLSGRPLLAGASLDDPLGESRDFYAVDSQGRLAYSSGDTMPRTTIGPGATRTVEVRMRAGRDFATAGPWRFSTVVDARSNQYAIFRAS